jgi:FimV-like protein
MGGRTVRRFLIACPLLLAAAAMLWGAEDTKKAADTRKALKTKVSFKWKDTGLSAVADEIHEQVNGLRFHMDTKGGINLNKQITYECKDKPVEDMLAELLGKFGWGYHVHSQKDAYDGDVYITVGDERGYVKGEEPAGKPKEDKPKDKPKVKPKTEVKPKEDKPKSENDPEKLEKDAARKLKLAKSLIEDGKTDGARDYLEEILKKYKTTKAAAEAKKLLENLDKDKDR